MNGLRLMRIKRERLKTGKAFTMNTQIIAFIASVCIYAFNLHFKADKTWLFIPKLKWDDMEFKEWCTSRVTFRLCKLFYLNFF